MQRIYSHPDVGMVHLVKNELENRGIEAVVRGEHLAGVIGGGAGIEAWFELWVVDDARVQEAAQIVQAAIAQATEAAEGEDVPGDPWTCPQCGEEIEPPFAVCWSCGQARPEGEAT